MSDPMPSTSPKKVADHNEVGYGDLPPHVASGLSEKDFLAAHLDRSQETYVVWVVDRALAKQRELEFDLTAGRFLTRAERIKRLPEPEKMAFPSLNLSVLRSYRLEPETDVLYEVFEVAGPASESFLCERLCFLPDHTSDEAFIGSHARKANFAREYAGYTREAKITHWVAMLYRSRRQTAESGGSEDAVFSPDLLVQMRAVDPEIEGILMDVIHSLADIECVDSTTLSAKAHALMQVPSRITGP